MCVNNLNHFTVDYKVTEKSFNFPKKYGLPFYFVSAADGTNVVKVKIFYILLVFCNFGIMLGFSHPETHK